MGRPRVHGDETRDALLGAAAEIVAAEGSAAVSVRRVAVAAGTTTRAVYSLFGDKEGLLRSVFHGVAERMLRYHEAVPRRSDPTKELLPLALAYRAAALERPREYELYLMAAGGTLEVTAEDGAMALRSFERVLDTLDRAVRARLLRGPAQERGYELWGLVHGLASLEIRGLLGPQDVALRRWRSAMTAVVDGYRVGSSRDRRTRGAASG